MIRAVLTDIEGTTTRTSFVTEVLFPFARARLASWVQAHPDAPELDATRSLAQAPEADLSQVTSILLGWMDEDRKATPLKSIQGLIWEEGYRSGALRSHVYPDVPEALRRWSARGLGLAVYSSGSVLAQRLLFGHTEAGDLRPCFSAWFDTTAGPKREPTSYRAIAAALGLEPGAILFLSDTPAEVEAATVARLGTALIEREGGRYTTFDDVEALLEPSPQRA